MLKGDDITVVDQYKYLQSTSRSVYQYHLSYFAPNQPCGIDPDELPEYELPPEDLCELTGSALAEVELVCEHVCPELRDECIYDACVYGATARPPVASARFADHAPLAPTLAPTLGATPDGARSSPPRPRRHRRPGGAELRRDDAGRLRDHD